MPIVTARALVASCCWCLLAGAPAAHAQQIKNKLTPDQLREEEAYTIGVQAYVYGFPAVQMYRTRHRAIYDSANKNRVAQGEFAHSRKLLDHNYNSVVSPNNDTLYSSAWLDLSAQPIVLDLPPVKERYYSFQFMDFFTNNFAIVGSRTTRGAPRTYVIVGPRWKGEVPKDAQRIDAPTNSVWLLGRTLVEGPADLDKVHALQDKYRLMSVEAWRRSGGNGKAPLPKPTPAPNLAQPLGFFEVLDTALRENAPPPRDAALVSLFGRIGLGQKKPFRVGALDPATARGLERAVTVAKQLIADRRADGTVVNGWSVPPRAIGNYGDDFLLRAQVAAWGLAALSPEEAIYFTTSHDEQGKPLDGKNRYVLRFEKGRLPPVDAFWSLTMYRLPELLLVNNPLGRYALGDRSKGLTYGADGSLELYLQHEAPAKERLGNWLPAPTGAFSLNLRAYLPRAQALDGTWKIPPVRSVD